MKRDVELPVSQTIPCVVLHRRLYGIVTPFGDIREDLSYVSLSCVEG